MNMMASATNFEVSHVTNEPKSLLRAKESETVRFETVLKRRLAIMQIPS